MLKTPLGTKKSRKNPYGDQKNSSYTGRKETMNIFILVWLAIVIYRIDNIVNENNRKIESLEQRVMDTSDDLRYILQYCNFTV